MQVFKAIQNINSLTVDMHPAFKNVGQTPGLVIWRIENFEPAVVSAATHGKFHTGDSYIILDTKGDGKSRLSWDIYFWLGNETTQDEAGAAAILSVKLDDALGGHPEQHREVQGHESDKFLTCFKNGIRYVAGGIASGFKQITINDDGPKRLFHVKGRKNVRVHEVEVSLSKMNKGDCFVLDAGRDIYIYVGPSSNGTEKLKAVAAGNLIRDQDHNGRSAVHVCDDDEKKEFFAALGSGSAAEVPEKSENDDDFEKKDVASSSLYKVSDASGELKVEEIASGTIHQDMLVTDDCFIVDVGSALYVWIGRGSTKQEKHESFKRAQDFIKSKNYPPSTMVHRLLEGTETAAFKQFFEKWND